MATLKLGEIVPKMSLVYKNRPQFVTNSTIHSTIRPEHSVDLYMNSSLPLIHVYTGQNILITQQNTNFENACLHMRRLTSSISVISHHLFSLTGSPDNCSAATFAEN